MDVTSIGKKERMKWKKTSWRCICFLISGQVVVKVFFPHDVKLAMEKCLSTDDLKYVPVIYVENVFYLQIK